MFPRRSLAVAAAGAIAFTSLGIAHATTYYPWSQVGGGGPSGGASYFAWNVKALAFSANDDTLYVAGSFSNLAQPGGGFVQLGNVGQWRASDNTWVAMGKGLTSAAVAIAASPRGSVYVGGQFSSATQRTNDTIPYQSVGRWRSSDDTWLPMGRVAWGTCLDVSTTCVVNALAVAAGDDTVYVGGNFLRVEQRTGAQLTVNGIARWRSSDDTWLTMGKGVAGGLPSTRVRAIATAGDDTVFVGGNFTAATQPTDDTIFAGQIAQWRASDDTWMPMGGRALDIVGGGAYVNDIEVVGNLVYVVGRFQFACNASGDGSCNGSGNGQVVAPGVAVYNMSTGMWSAVGSPPWGLLPIKSIVALPSSQLLVMTDPSASSASLYLWDGSSWSVAGTLAGSPTLSSEALATDDTNLYVGGIFSSIGSTGGSMSTIFNIARGVPGASPSPSPTPTPTPAPVYPPDAPTDLKATAGSGEATITWTAPTYVGSYPVTDYQVTSSTGPHTCLSKTTTCTVTGLTGGTTYTFTVRALNGAGWGAYSAPSNAVTPIAKSILITGSRDSSDDRYVTVKGTTTDLAGKQVVPWVRLPGQTEHVAGTGARIVSADGTFSWQRKTGKRISVYFEHAEVRSNSVTIAAR